MFSNRFSEDQYKLFPWMYHVEQFVMYCIYKLLGSLPPTAYVKMVDIWLIFSQSIPFVEVLLHTGIDNMREEGNKRAFYLFQKKLLLKGVRVSIKRGYSRGRRGYCVQFRQTDSRLGNIGTFLERDVIEYIAILYTST